MGPVTRFRRWKQRRQGYQRMRDVAYQDAFGLCSTWGPQSVANQYGLPYAPGDFDELALRYAAMNYHPKAVLGAYRGARDGFDEWRRWVRLVAQ